MRKASLSPLGEHESKLNSGWRYLPEPYRLGLNAKTRTGDRVCEEVRKRQMAALHNSVKQKPSARDLPQISGPASGTHLSDGAEILAAVNRQNSRDHLAADHRAAYRTDSLIRAAYEATMRGEDVPLLCNYSPPRERRLAA